MTCEFPAQMARNAENVTIWSRHHDHSEQDRFDDKMDASHTMGILVRGTVYPCTNMDLLPWVSNYIRYKVWDEITNPFPNINAEAIDGREWMCKFTGH